MTTEEELKTARRHLDDSIRASHEKPGFGERIKTGFITGIIGGAIITPFLTALDIGWNKWIHKKSWNHNVGIKSILLDFGLSAGIFGTINAAFNDGNASATRSVKRIQAAYDDVRNAESKLASENLTTIQTAGAKHSILDPQEQTRQP